MRNSRSVLMLVFSVITGAAAVFLALQWSGKEKSLETETVVVVKKDIDVGQQLEKSMLDMIPWVASAKPRGSFTNIDDVVGRVVAVTMSDGEPVLASKLAEKGAKAGLASVISKGKRAISVKVNEVVGVAGFALPGNYVDVLVNAHDEKGNPFSRIVLGRILVLAVAQEASRDESKPKVVNAVTLEVTPEQAEKLDLARSIGSLSLVLRNQVDVDDVDSEGARSDDLLDDAASQPAVVVEKTKVEKKDTYKPPKKEKIEVIKGIEKSDVKL